MTVIALIVLAAGELAVQYTGDKHALVLCRYAFLGLCICIAPSFKLREWALAAFALLLTAGLLLKEDGSADIWFALDRAAFFAGFIYLVTLLKEAAERSPSVLELGTYLTKQPTGRRYFSLAFGGHIMGVLLNFGAISLLTPLIQRGARSAEDQQQVKNLEQQQLSALIRGFSWMIMWSPTALTQAVLFTSFPGADLGTVIPLGIGFSLLMIFIGRVDDRIRWRNVTMTQTIEIPRFPRKSAIRFSTICVVLIVSTLIVMAAADVSAAMALMLVAPIVMVTWVFEQNSSGQVSDAIAATSRTLKNILNDTAASQGRVAVTLGCAGFIGEAAARIAPIDLLANYLTVLDVPKWAFLIAIPIIITLCGQIALSPLIVVVFLSSIFNQLPNLPADPSLLIFAMGAGWALSMTASPNASATLLISGVTGIAPTTLTWRWNGAYALMCFAAFSAAFVILAR